MAKYRKKPVVIDAVQFLGSEISAELMNLIDNSEQRKVVFKSRGMDAEHLIIETLEGFHRADINDWIIRGVKDELYPCKPDIFELTYEKVDD